MRAPLLRLLALTALALGLAAAASCSFKADPDKDRFNCTTDSDCGDGWSCVTQKRTGKGICFAKGACKAESCNGLDDDCDGEIDDLPEIGQACDPHGAAVCNPGTQQCGDGGLVCVGQILKRPEACDGVSDLDCDGLVGCADPDCFSAGCGASDGGNCGTSGPLFDGGSPPVALDAGFGDGGVPGYCARREEACDNGRDDDGDGRTDCADPDCLGRTCVGGGTCLSDGGCQ